MNEISHRQAERLISRQFDHLLSDEEWVVLQNHLEHCSNCVAYQSRHTCTQSRISQCFRDRWDAVNGPSTHLPLVVSKIHREKAAMRTNTTTTFIYVAVFFIILLFAAFRFRSRGLQETVPPTGGNGESPTWTTLPTPVSTMIPLIMPGQFPHIIAYESKTDGNAEIYLLNPGFGPVNLTQHPAEDTFPTWSPDGEWLAFLSNRATLNKQYVKNELYVISIAGNKLIQLTSESLVDWNGPLSWSADGKWIAVMGMRLDDSQPGSIYIVSIDGSGPRPLLNTQGGASPKFAPYGDRLAFRQTVGSLDRIVIYHIDSDQISFENIPGSNDAFASPDVSFDWPADGDGIYYITARPSSQSIDPTLTPECSRIVIKHTPNNEGWQDKLRDHFHLVNGGTPDTVRSISWAPNELVIYFVDIEDQDRVNHHCDTLENCVGFLDFTNLKWSNSNDSIVFTDLCVQSYVDRGSWSLDMHWLILTAYEQDIEDTGLYAVRMPGLNLSWQLSGTESVQSALIPTGTVFRLSPDIIQSSLPRMRPFRTCLNIEPHPVLVESIQND